MNRARRVVLGLAGVGALAAFPIDPSLKTWKQLRDYKDYIGINDVEIPNPENYDRKTVHFDSKGLKCQAYFYKPTQQPRCVLKNKHKKIKK